MRVSLRKIALIAVVVYVVIATAFGKNGVGLAQLSTYSRYLLFGVCALYLIIRRKFELNLLMRVLIIFGVILTISALYSPTEYSIISSYLYRYWVTLAAIFLISNVVKSSSDLRTLRIACIGAGVVYSLYLYSYYGFDILIEASRRIDNQLGNQNEIAMYCAFSILLALFELFSEKKRYMQMLFGFAALICVPALLFTGSRKGILIVIVGILLLFLAYNERKGTIRRYAMLALMISSVVFFMQSIPYFESVTDRFLDLFQFASGSGGHSSDITRFNMIIKGLDIFLNSPIVGNGFLSSYYYFGMYSHNNMVELLMDTGVIGFIAFYASHGYCFYGMVKMRKSDRRGYAFIAMCLAAMLMTDIGVVSFYNHFVMILLLMMYKTVEFNRLSIGEKNEIM